MKKKSPVNDKSKHLKSKDEVWKHLWRLFIRQFLNSELLKKVFYHKFDFLKL